MTNPIPFRTQRTQASKILLTAALALLASFGCQSTNVSRQGGVVPTDEGFSITVPATATIKQGGVAEISIMLNRGAHFKRDVRLDIKADGIDATPDSVWVKASDRPEVKVQVSVDRSAALGEYRVTVTGTPMTGLPASTVFLVRVVPQ